MKKLVGPYLCTLLAISVPGAALAQPSAPPSAEDASELREAHAIIEIMFPPAERQKMIDKTLNDLAAPMRQNLPAMDVDDPGLKALFKEFMDQTFERQRPLMYKHMPNLLEAMAVAYTHEFSLAELKQIHAFALSPAGGHYLSRSTAIIGDPAVTKVYVAMIADANETSKATIAEFKAKLIAYFSDHPDAAAKVSAAAKTKAE